MNNFTRVCLVVNFGLQMVLMCKDLLEISSKTVAAQKDRVLGMPAETFPQVEPRAFSWWILGCQHGLRMCGWQDHEHFSPGGWGTFVFQVVSFPCLKLEQRNCSSLG